MRPAGVKSWLALLTLLTLLTLIASANAQFVYYDAGGSYYVSGYTGPGGNVTIPSTYNGLPVTGIGYDAFANCTNLTGVTIPNTVTTIFDEAFWSCSSLTNITLPNSVTSLGARAIGHCGNLPSITLPNSLTNIGDYCFQRDTNLISLVIPGSVTTLGQSPFYRCTGLLRMNIPASVRSIGLGPFAYCTNLLSVTADLPNPSYSSVDGVLFDKSQARLVQYPGGRRGHYTVPNGVRSIGGYAFSFCYNLPSVTLPTSLTNLEEGSFAASADDTTPAETNLMAAWFQGNAPAAGVYDGVSTFDGEPALTSYYCAGTRGWGSPFGGRPAMLWNANVPYVFVASSEVTLQRYVGPAGNVTIPDNISGVPVTTIIDGAFSGYANLTNVTIPASVTTIIDWAFGDCRNLNAITVVSSNPAYTNVDGVLFSKNRTLLVQCPAGKSSSYVIPDGVISIRDRAFAGCGGLNRIVIPSSVTNIGNYAFENCTNLSSLVVPASVAGIGDGAFSLCSSLTAVYFQGNAPRAGWNLFNLATNATVYYLPGTTNWSTAMSGTRTVAWNPVIQTTDGKYGVRNNRFGFDITGSANIPLAVEASVSLGNPAWSVLQTCTLTNGSIYFSDPAWNGYSLRVYRLRSP